MDIEVYYDKIYRYIFYKVNNKALAEDLTQETFYKFLKSECEEPERFLYTIARNLCIDEYRRIKPVSTEDEEALAVSTEDEEALAVTTEFEDALVERTAVKEALDKLSEDDRELVILRLVNDEPIGEIAKMYGMSRFAVTRRLNKAKSTLKELLERGSDER